MSVEGQQCLDAFLIGVLKHLVSTGQRACFAGRRGCNFRDYWRCATRGEAIVVIEST